MVKKVLTSKVINEKKINTNVTRKTIRFTGKKLKLQDVKQMCDKINSSIPNSGYKIKYVVTAQTINHNAFTLKGYRDENIRYDSMSDYLAGRVKEETKFSKILSFDVMMMKELIV